MVTDLLGGQVQFAFDAIASSIEHIRAGRLRALACRPTTRIDVLPDLPTVGEFVPGYEASPGLRHWRAAHTPAEIIDKLNGRSTRASPIRGQGAPRRPWRRAAARLAATSSASCSRKKPRNGAR